MYYPNFSFKILLYYFESSLNISNFDETSLEMGQELTDEEILSALERKIERLHSEYQRIKHEYESEVKKYELARNAFGSSKLNSLAFIPIKNSVDLNANSFLGKVDTLLMQRDEPLIGREIFDALGLDNYNSFSAKFSQSYRKENSPIDQIEINNVHPKLKFFYVRKSWLINGKLKDEYFNKILKRQDMIAA